MAEEEVVEEKKKGGKGLIIALIVVVVLLLVGVGALVYMLLGSNSSEEGSGDGAEVHASAEHGAEEGETEAFSRAKTYSDKYKQFEPPTPETAPAYFVMDKFVVNFNGEGKAKFLAVDLQFLSYYVAVVGPDGEMENLRPILKNDIQRLLRNQYFTALNTPDGPDTLRAEILKVAHNVLEQHNIYPDLVEDVYMTRFVMQ